MKQKTKMVLTLGKVNKDNKNETKNTTAPQATTI